MAVAAFSEEAVTDADVDAATTAACGSSFCSSSAADAATDAANITFPNNPLPPWNPMCRGFSFRFTRHNFTTFLIY